MKHVNKRKGLSSIQMSKLYKAQIRKGVPKAIAYKNTGMAKKISKNKLNNPWRKGKFGKFKNMDFDGDGKVNKYDCKPFNKHKQDSIDSMEKIFNPDKYKKYKYRAALANGEVIYSTSKKEAKEWDESDYMP